MQSSSSGPDVTPVIQQVKTRNKLPDPTHLLSLIHTHITENLPSSSFLRVQFPDGSEGKASACNAGDLGSIPGPGRSPGGGNGNPLQ